MKKVIGSALCLSVLLLGVSTATASASTVQSSECVPFNKPCKQKA